MTIDDLNLEFEDAEEKKEDGLKLDHDLDFTAVTKVIDSELLKQLNATRTSITKADLKLVNDSTDATDISQQIQINNEPSLKSDTRIHVDSHLKLLQDEIRILREGMHQVQTKAEVEVAVVQAEQKLLIEHISDAKVLDVEITRILLKMNAKAPIIKGEAQAIKKLLNKFIKKSTPS